MKDVYGEEVKDRIFQVCPCMFEPPFDKTSDIQKYHDSVRYT